MFSLCETAPKTNAEAKAKAPKRCRSRPHPRERPQSSSLRWRSDFFVGRQAGVRSGASCQPGERVTMSEKHAKTQSAASTRGRSRTAWNYLDRVADDEIAAAIAGDRDTAPLDIDWSKAEIVVPAKKKAISIRIDPDVLDFFKNEGPGYQRRINAVLRSYVEQKQKRGKSA
jgi:uncharacterized protein (DUF4415 family)